MRNLRAALVVALAVVVLVPGCATERRAEISESPGMRKVRVGTLAIIANAPTYLAKQNRYFARRGLDVEFVKVQTSATALPALASGRLDAVIGSTSPALINAVAKGTGIKAVADEGQIVEGACNRHSIVASPRVLASGQVDDFTDLKGRKVVYTATSIDAYFMYRTLRSIGLTLDDIVATDVPSEVLPSALGRGDLDFALVAEPELTRVVSAGKARDWFQMGRHLVGVQTSMVLFGPNFLQEDPDAGRRFVAANLEGIKAFERGKTPDNVRAVSDFSEIDENLVAKTCWPTFSKDGRINWESVDEIQRWLLSRKQIDKLVTEEQFWTDEFLPR